MNNYQMKRAICTKKTHKSNFKQKKTTTTTVFKHLDNVNENDSYHVQGAMLRELKTYHINFDTQF